MVHIAEVGVAIHILGAWPGNNVDDEDPWLRVLQKAAASLERWHQQHPTLNRCRQIVQAYIGGGTQYLTAAQGMPSDMVRHAETLSMDFMWEYKRSHTVNVATLKLPRERGGLGLLDISARNDAIYLNWLREYADATENRPIWADVVDEILHRTTLDCQDRVGGRTDMLSNFLLQNWTPTSATPTRENSRPNSQATGLPLELKMMVSVAKRYGVTVDAPFIAQEARLSNSVWLHHDRHPGMHPRLNPTQVACLLDNHKVRTVADATESGRQPGRGERPHANRCNCACPCCHTAHRLYSCNDLNACQKTTRKIVSELGDKWGGI